MRGILLSGYDAFKSDTSSPWTELENAVNDLPAIYHVVQKAAVYSLAIALVLSAAGLIWAANNPKKLGESKDKIIRIFVVGIAVFGVGEIVALIYNLAP